MSTTPDIYFPEKRLAIYIDGVQVHVKRQEKDETLRELLAKRYGVKVLSIPYERYSKRELERIVNTIMEELRDENSENLSKLRKNVQYFPLRGKASR
jgi:very-short-patch-repair endonuclease